MNMKDYFLRMGRKSFPLHLRHRAFPERIFKVSSFILCLHTLQTNAFLNKRF